MQTNDTASHDLEALTSDQFRDVIGRFASGVTVVTVNKDDKPLGTTASAFTSLSVEPPMILVCLNRTSETGKAVHEAGRFAVNILGEGHPDLAMRFAGKGDKFEGVVHEPGAHGEPLLVDALATLECTVKEETIGGTHFVFIASVESASATPGAPLTYFRGEFGRFQHSDDEAAYSSVRDQVLSREIEPGKPLDLDTLSAQTGIDRNALYHALSRLTNDGLVQRSPNGVFEVIPVTPELMAEGVRARAAIQLGVAMQRAGNLSADEIAGCERLLDEMDKAEAGPLEPWLRLLDTYLDHFVALAGSPSLLEAHKRVNAISRISSERHAASGDERPPKNATASHRRVLEAVAGSDLEAVFSAIQRRTEGTIRALGGSIEKAGGKI